MLTPKVGRTVVVAMGLSVSGRLVSCFFFFLRETLSARRAAVCRSRISVRVVSIKFLLVVITSSYSYFLQPNIVECSSRVEAFNISQKWD